MSKNIVKNEKSQEKKNGNLPISASALLCEDFPEPKWIVQDILPEGSLSILAARPKTGKTFLALQFALSITLGRFFILKKTQKAPVLFLSLELNKRQMQKRISLLLNHLGVQTEEAKKMGGQKFPFFLSFANHEDIEGLRHTLNFFKEKGLKIEVIFIDTYVLFKNLGAGKKEGKTAYELESQYLAKLRKFCEEEEVSIVLIYHSRKKQAISNDITEDVMGSTGITGAVNNLLLLDRKTGSKEAHLKITGHDIEEYDLELTFEKGWFKSRTVEDKEREIMELVVNYLKQVGQANQSSITSYLKSKGYKSVHEIKEILDKYSQENSENRIYWYVSRKKREGGGTSLKIFSLTSTSAPKQGELIKEDDVQERSKLVERVENLLNQKVFPPDDFPEKLESFGIFNFQTLAENVENVQLDILSEYVKKLESYSQEDSKDFDF